MARHAGEVMNLVRAVQLHDKRGLAHWWINVMVLLAMMPKRRHVEEMRRGLGAYAGGESGIDWDMGEGSG